MIPRFALIIGAMKSGTTTLFDHLSGHPEICPCEEKEPNFFANPGNFARGLPWYESRFPWDGERHRVALEATMLYSWADVIPDTEGVPARIASTPRDFRFIYLVRDPIARIESHITYTAIRDEVGDFDTRADTVPEWLISVSDYWKQLECYFEHFDPKRVLVATTEELRANPGALLARIESFLELSPFADEAAAYPPSNVTRGQVAPPPLWQRLRRMPFLRSQVRRIPAPVRGALRDRLARPVETHVALNPAQRRYVRSRLQSGMTRLGDELGIPVERWDF